MDWVVFCRWYVGCSGMKLVSTGKRNEKGGFDINSKVALGMFKKLDNYKKKLEK